MKRAGHTASGEEIAAETAVEDWLKTKAYVDSFNADKQNLTLQDNARSISDPSTTRFGYNFSRCPRSSMDRVTDFESAGLGSNPGGGTLL